MADLMTRAQEADALRLALGIITPFMIAVTVALVRKVRENQRLKTENYWLLRNARVRALSRVNAGVLMIPEDITFGTGANEITGANLMLDKDTSLEDYISAHPAAVFEKVYLQLLDAVRKHLTEFYLADMGGDRIEWPGELERLVEWKVPEEEADG